LRNKNRKNECWKEKSLKNFCYVQTLRSFYEFKEIEEGRTKGKVTDDAQIFCLGNTVREHVLRVEHTGIQFRIWVNDSFALQKL